jgi:hypothetical protein
VTLIGRGDESAPIECRVATGIRVRVTAGE